MRFVSVDLYYIKIASTPTCISSNYVKICTFLFFLIFFMDVNLHLEYLFDVFKVYKWLRYTSILYNCNLTKSMVSFKI